MRDPSPAKTALVLGKFMPLHQGHVALLHFAQARAERLYVVVDHLTDAPISGERRCAWLRRTMPEAHIYYLPRPNPQQPEDHPDFWTIWRESLRALLPEPIDLVVASEPYGERLAKELDAKSVLFDVARQHLPISATTIRGNLLSHWEWLAEAAKPDSLMRVCLFGAESTGKSTLARELAAHFHTQWVPEYAREWIESHGTPQSSDMLSIAQGQQVLEEQHAIRAERYLFCDTDAFITSLWHRWLFGTDAPGILALAEHRRHDLYLLTEIDLPWVADPARYFPEERAAHQRQCIEMLERYHLPYTVISGDGPERLNCAIEAVEHMRQPFFPQTWRKPA